MRNKFGRLTGAFRGPDHPLRGEKIALLFNVNNFMLKFEHF